MTRMIILASIFAFTVACCSSTRGSNGTAVAELPEAAQPAGG